MAIGLGLLRLPPEAFWSLTLPELAAAIAALRGDFTGAAPLDAGELAALMALFPDETGKPDHE